MKTIVVLLLALLLGTAIAFQYVEEWELWKKKHNKSYKDDSEELYRRTIWARNKAYVEEHNAHADKFGFTVAMNKFADMVNSLSPIILYSFIPSLLSVLTMSFSFPFLSRMGVSLLGSTMATFNAYLTIQGTRPECTS